MKNSETEQKIKDAANIVFKQKGYKEAKTRDIAEQAGVNLALINYYYKSKEALFEEIMLELLLVFRNDIQKFLNDEHTSVIEKITLITEKYTSLLQQEPDLPLFIIQETQKAPDFILKTINPSKIMKESFFNQQLTSMGKSQKEIENIVINTMSLIILPFTGKSILKILHSDEEQEFLELTEQRKKEIPTWINKMFSIENN